MSRFTHLADWLKWMENLHPVEIDLGLTRVHQVARQLGLIASPSEIDHPLSGQLSLPNCLVFTVAGTNGKGTCSATLTACLVAQQYRVGTYTSPHLHHYSERICIDGKPVDDDLICAAFAAIDEARGDTSLSYFEFGTLAALWVFIEQQVDVVVLEVGLGGRLDAVNIVDADVAIVTSIDIDHKEWLGDDRDTIAKEKLGIARQARPLIIAETYLTPALEQSALDYPSQVIGRDFMVTKAQGLKPTLTLNQNGIVLPSNGLHPNSVSAGLVALAEKNLLPEDKQLQSILANLSLLGRCEKYRYQDIDILFDVAHNRAAIEALNQYLDHEKFKGRTLAVMAIMADKDYAAIISCLADQIDKWYVGDLIDNPRALTANKLASLLTNKQCSVTQSDDINQAFDLALSQANTHDRIIVFGSFFTVAAIKDHISTR